MLSMPRFAHTVSMPSSVAIVEIPEEETKERELIILSGVPCSGKSTLVKEMLEEDKEATVISRDDILMEYGKEKFGESDYSAIWDKLSSDDQKGINELLEKRIKDASENSNKVIIDMTMLTKKIRRDMIEKFPGFKVSIIGVVVPFRTILERNKKRYEETGKNIPLNVLQDMWMRLEFPSVAEHPNVMSANVIVQG